MTAPESRMAALANELKTAAGREVADLENRLMHVLADYQKLKGECYSHLISNPTLDVVIAACDSMPGEPERTLSRLRLAELLED